MTSREQLHLLVVKLGMKTTLEELVIMLDKHKDADYCVRLSNDLKEALKTYECRHTCTNMVSTYQNGMSGSTRCVLESGHEGSCKSST
jgi:hypothetical protein